jgi:hypothetical protein
MMPDAGFAAFLERDGLGTLRRGLPALFALCFDRILAFTEQLAALVAQLARLGQAHVVNTAKTHFLAERLAVFREVRSSRHRNTHERAAASVTCKYSPAPSE